jgi:hypothetical protein
MLSTEVVNRIEDLLRSGKLSQRMIARRLKVSRGTVLAIARGRRPDYARRATPKDEVPSPAGSPKRCPGCGGLVQMPCLLCYIRRLPTPHNRNTRPRNTTLVNA